MSAVTQTRLKRLDALVEEARRISVIVHTHPDGDALGSGQAMAGYLRECRGKDALLMLPDPFPETLSYFVDGSLVMVGSEGAAEAGERLSRSDLLICLDFNNFSRAGSLEPLLRASDARKVLIDHHIGPSEADFDLVFSETEISSSCELLYLILKAMPGMHGGGDLPLTVATKLMLGMTTDTNNFGNSVYPSTLAMAGELLAAGVDRDDIISHLYNEYRENRYRAMGCFLGELMHITECGVAYVVLRRKTIKRFALAEGETEGFVNIPLGISRVKMSVFLREDQGHFRVSIRSKKGWSANRLAAAFFNGGGHECAAGGKLYFPGDIPSRKLAEEYVETVTARFMQESAPAEQ